MTATYHCDPDNLCQDCRKRIAGELVEGLKPVVEISRLSLKDALEEDRRTL